MPADQVPKFIRDVMGALEAGGAVAGAVSDERPTPAVPIRKSVAADHVTCLVCGKRMKALKRHIRAAHDMTEQEYREAFDLPRDHPMVSRNYSRQRAEMAKRIGLGQTSGRRRSKK